MRNERRVLRAICFGLLSLGGFAGLLQAEPLLGPWVPMFQGVDHAVGTNVPSTEYPNLQVAHVMRIDLADPDIRLLASPRIANYEAGIREVGGMTVSRFLQVHGTQVAINANFFSPGTYYLPEGTPMKVSGFFMSQGQVVSTQESRVDSASIVFDAENHATVIHTNWPAVSSAGLYTAVSGDYPLVVAGDNVGRRYLGNSDPVHNVNPRTAFGLSADKRFLYLLTIDGRQQGYSDGALDYETGAWMVLAGAADAVNMDGGGSTTLSVQGSTGAAIRLNRSSAVADSGKERTVGSHLGIFAKPLTGFVHGVTVQPDDVAASITWSTSAASTTQVEYGPTQDLGLATELQTALTTNHSVLLSGLAPGTGYYFRAVSTVGAERHSSADLFFTTTNYVNVRPVFSPTAAWKFSTENLDGRNWTASGYNDSTWSGPGDGLLWVDVRSTGPNPEVQPKGMEMPADPGNEGYPFFTYYFRTHFNLADLKPGTGLKFSGYVDDGAVLYLNGVEVYRLRMPDAPAVISNADLAVGFPCSGDANCLDEWTLLGDSVAALRNGDNVLAAEVHNYNPHSADITWGVGLDLLESAPPEPRITLVADGDTVTLSWDRGGFVLQESVLPSGPWVDVPGPVVMSPFTAVGSTSTRYYRLHR